MRLGELLEKKYSVLHTDIDRALEFQKNHGGRLGSILINMGLISEDILLNALSEQLGWERVAPFIEKNSIDPDYGRLWEVFNIDFLKRKRCVPIKANVAGSDRIFFVTDDPLDVELLDYLYKKEDQVSFLLCSEEEANHFIEEFSTAQSLLSGQEQGEHYVTISEDEIDRLKEMASEAPVVNLVNSLISKGVKKKASDFHIEPHGTLHRIRYRIDGRLVDEGYLPQQLQLPAISRIKILAGMDIAEKRLPQDGKIGIRIAGREMDIRVSSLPLSEGESIVLRLLFKDTEFVELKQLGIENDVIDRIVTDIQRSSGIVLVTGPTGSGKTTTLYAVLKYLNAPDVKIITVENPVEYELKGINQIQVRHEIGYNFAKALRSILRQDPDIIMIGEIRDKETAEMSIQSSLTGHLVFSTLHTNDAISTITRLTDLGVDRFLLNDTIAAVSAQRLVRRICPQCRVEDKEGLALLKNRGVPLEGFSRIYTGSGCENCNGTGFSGRVPIMEYIPYDDEIKAMDTQKRFNETAWQYLRGRGIRTLQEDGLLKVKKGITSVKEVLRVT